MNKFLFWQKWLFVVALFISVFGVVMALFNGTTFFNLFNQQIDPAFWGTHDLPDTAITFRGWVYGVWGATVAGWGIFFAFIVYYPFRKKEVWSRNCLVFGLLLWYVLDTAISIAFGVTFNAIFNTLLLIMAGLPVGLTWGSFSRNGT